MIIFYLTQIALLSLHVANYKEHFANMGITFALTFACKKLLKSMDEKEKSSMVGLAGYALVLAEFMTYLGRVRYDGTHNALRPELNLQEKGQLGIQDMIKNGIEALMEKKAN